MSAVAVAGLRKVYGSGETAVTALADATFAVAPGELVAILGPSGSGKTTLLTTVGLVTEPSAGRVAIDGALLADGGWLPGVDVRRVRREKLGFIFQSHNLIPFLTARENVMVALTVAGVGDREARRRAGELLGELGLGDRLGHHPAQLSGGQSQRVAIARALANRPRVVLADEPTAALDTPNGLAVMALLKRLAVEHRSAILVVTHDRRMVDGFDRILEVSDGRVADGGRRAA